MSAQAWGALALLALGGTLGVGGALRFLWATYDPTTRWRAGNRGLLAMIWSTPILGAGALWAALLNTN